MFVTFECGCVGIEFGVDGSESIVLMACDEDRDRPRESLSWFTRNMRGKAVEPVSADIETRLYQRIASRFAKADRFDDVRRALGVPEDI